MKLKHIKKYKKFEEDENMGKRRLSQENIKGMKVAYTQIEEERTK